MFYLFGRYMRRFLIFKYNNWIVWFIMSMIALASIAIIGIGADNYMYLYGYRTFLSYPHENMFLFQWYFTYFICDILGIYTIVYSRIAGCIVIIAIWIISYAILKNVVNNKVLGFGLFLSTIGLYGTTVDINYNNITILFMLIGILFIVKSIRRHYLITIAGLVYGVSLFLRLPNLIFSIFGLSPLLLYFYHHNYTKKNILLQLSLFYIGYIIGVISIVFLMKVCGHYSIFINMMNMAANGPVDGGVQDHSFIALIFHAVKCYLSPLLVFVVLAFLINQFSNWQISKKGWFDRMLLCLMILAFLIISKSACMLYWMIVTPIIIYILINKRKTLSEVEFYISCLALLMMYLFPVGSASIMSFSGPNVFWLSIPLALHFMSKFDNMWKIRQQQYSMITIAILVCIIIKSTLFISFSLYKGQNRFNSLYTFKSHILEGILTTKNNVEDENNVSILKKYIHPQSYVLTSNSKYAILLDAKPFGIVNYFIPTHYYRALIAEALKHTKELPYVVVDNDQNIFENTKGLFSEIDYDKITINSHVILYIPKT